MGTPGEVLARSLNASASVKKGEDQLRLTKRYVHSRVAKCTDVDGGFFVYYCQL